LSLIVRMSSNSRRNLQSGEAAVVKVEDRGQFVASCVMDVTPKVAEELAMTNRGVVPVEVKPITVPQANGRAKLGAGAADLSPQQVREISRVSMPR
jgi:peptidoglycan lytic transglycosylase